MSHADDQNSDYPSDHSSQPDFETLRNRMNLELEGISVNQLFHLANEAVDRKLITAHGYRRGQYDLLRDGEFITMTPTEAIQYLQNLLNETDA